MLLHGPPGTGKTVLTDTLPQIIGLTPICEPMSASEVRFINLKPIIFFLKNF
jgi:hypothetical protein